MFALLFFDSTLLKNKYLILTYYILIAIDTISLPIKEKRALFLFQNDPFLDSVLLASLKVLSKNGNLFSF